MFPAPSRPCRGTAHKVELTATALAILLFCILGLWQLDLPGLYQDEAYDAAPALRLLQGRAGWPYVLLPGTLDWPLMVSDHVGPTSTYLLLPFLSALGPGARALRIYEFTCGLAALLLVFLWARRGLGTGGSWLAVLLLAVTPSFWLGCRNGIHVSFILVPLALGALLAFDGWYSGKPVGCFYVGAFLVGVGLATKILFAWFVFALALGVLLLQREVFRRLRWPSLSRGLACAGLGASPFLLFNLLSRGLTFRSIWGNFIQTPYGVRNTAFFPNLRTQLHSFSSLLDGSWLTWAGDAPRNPLSLWLFLAAAGYLVLHWKIPGLRRVRFCLLALAALLLASCFTITTLGPKHLVIMLPFPPIITAGALGLAWSRRHRLRSRMVFALLSLLAVLQFAWDLHSDLRYHRVLSATGGVGLFSHAHNQLADYLLLHRAYHPLAGDWGFQDNLEVLSAGRVSVGQIFELTDPSPYPFTREQARRLLKDPEAVFIFHAEPFAAAPGRLEAVRQVAAEMGVRLSQEAVFKDGLGRPVILVYHVASLTRPSLSDNILPGGTGLEPVLPLPILAPGGD